MNGSLEVSTSLAPDALRRMLDQIVQVAQSYDREYLVTPEREPGTFAVRSDRVLIQFAVEISTNGSGGTFVRSRITDPDPAVGRGLLRRRERQPEGYPGYADFLDVFGNTIAITDPGASVRLPSR